MRGGDGLGSAGGAVWNDVDPATQLNGLAVPGGTFGDTGVGGLTLGGGIGWLIGTHGLTCDNLVRAELVTPAGDVVIAGEEGDAELLWALRGGGGNFGIVTSFELALHERGPMLAGVVVFRVQDTADVLTGIAEMMREAPDELVVQPTVSAHICRDARSRADEWQIAPRRGLDRGCARGSASDTTDHCPCPSHTGDRPGGRVGRLAEAAPRRWSGGGGCLGSRGRGRLHA